MSESDSYRADSLMHELWQAKRKIEELEKALEQALDENLNLRRK